MEAKINSSSRRVFWEVWTSYAIYYFGKVNLGIIVPALLATYKHLSLYNVGLVSSGFFLCYAIGQFVHGQISERYNPFKYIAAGLIISAILNIFLGAWGNFFSVLLIGEMIDGFFQAMGWSSVVRANALSRKKEDRDNSGMLLGTSYQIGNSFAWLVSAWVVGAWGWRAGFYVAAAFMLARGILLILTMPTVTIRPEPRIATQIKRTISAPIVLNGLALCFLNMVRYGVITWIPLYLFQVGNLTVKQMGKVGVQVFLIPVFGVLGTLVFNMIKLKKDITAIISLIFLAASFVVFPMTTGLTSLMVLFAGSFFLYGTHVFLVSTFPTRFGDKNIISASTGFIDGMGYIGTVSIGVIIPFLINLAGGHWKYVFIFWVVMSLVTAATVLLAYWSTKNE